MPTKRICIFVTYDKQNIVDEYIAYILSELKENCNYLVVICNYPEIKMGREYVEKYASQVFYRKNRGFDCGGFKDAMCNFIGWDIIDMYDELVLVNDSFFGPFIPLSNIFSEMETRKVDFWGVIAHAYLKRKKDQDIPEHLQSFFLTIQTRMLHSKEFRGFWESLPYFGTFSDAVKGYEHIFTEYFKKKGFKYSCFANIKNNNSENPENNYWQYAYISYELIAKRNFPFLKKQQLSYDMLEHQTQENYLRAIEYIDKNTNYDVNLIWKNIIRTLDVNDIYRNFHLNFIIDRNKVACKRGENYKVLICARVNHMSAFEFVSEYLTSINKENEAIHILVYSDDVDLIRKYNTIGLNILQSQSRYVFFETITEYDYICYIHDYDLSSKIQPSYINKSLFFNVWGNLIGENNHVDKIIDIMQSNKYIGVLMPPEPNYGVFFGKLYKKWDDQYDKVKSVIERKNINCICSREIPPFSVSDNVWIKKDLLQWIRILGDNEVDILQYLWVYLAQSKLLLSGIVESDEYAAIDEINIKKYMSEIINQVVNQYGNINDFMDLKKYIFSGAIKEFCEKYKYIYVYGTGFIAKEYQTLIPKIDGYIVSDGYEKQDYFENKKVFFLSEIAKQDNMGIVICLDKKNQKQVVPLLKEMQFYDFFCT